MKRAVPLLSALVCLAISSAAAPASGEPALIAFPEPILDGMLPAPSETGVPLDTLLWVQTGDVVLVGPDGDVALEPVANISAITVFAPAEALAPETEYTVLGAGGEFALGSFTTGTDLAAPPTRPEIVETVDQDTRSWFGGGRFVDVTLAWEGALLLVEPDADTLDAITRVEALSQADVLTLPLDEGGATTRRIVAVNLAGELSDERVFSHQAAGCTASPGAALALAPLLLLVRRRTRAPRSSDL